MTASPRKGRLAVGLIGLGRLGRVYARDLASRIPETRLVAVADPVGSLAEEIAAFPWRSVMNDRRAVYDGLGLSAADALANEDRLGREVIFGDDFAFLRSVAKVN